jgi:hypothetical protein
MRSDAGPGLRATWLVAIGLLVAAAATTGTVLAGPQTAPKLESAVQAAASPLPPPPGTTERMSVGNDERQANGASGGVSALLAAANGDQAISADGRWVAFVSAATNLTPGQARPGGGVFLRDRLSGDTIAIPWFGGVPFPAGISAAEPTISRDGGVVAFTAVVVPNAAVRAIALPTRDPYVLLWDRITNLTEIVSLDPNGGPVPGFQPSISADGQTVAYTQWAAIATPPPTKTPAPTPNPGPSLSNLNANPQGFCPDRTFSTISVTAIDPNGIKFVRITIWPPGQAAIGPFDMIWQGSNVWAYNITPNGWNAGYIAYQVTAYDNFDATSTASSVNNPSHPTYLAIASFC